MIRHGNKKDTQVNMMSILDNDELDDYIITTEMAGEEQEVHRVHQNDSFLIEASTKKNIQAMSLNEFSYQHLVIPRKPAWNSEMTAEEVDYNEKKAFLQWRRDIAALESSSSGKKVTPFEKNLDVWRQLWRVVERSDMLIQIVDARNPLLYYTNDLMKYIKEQNVSKRMMLIINKADFLTEYHRLAWVHQMNKLKLRFMFYSAKIEQTKLDEGKETENPCDTEEIEFLVRNVIAQWDRESAAGKAAAEPGLAAEEFENSKSQTKILNRTELLLFLDLIGKALNLVPQKKHNGRICVGMVGYPNVGKSSVINTLLGVSKSTHGKLFFWTTTSLSHFFLLGVVRVGVSSTPGKTKHFQTLVLSDTLMLCDCPGLVFPSFMNSTGEMICAGILPINQMRDYIEPAAVIAARVPQHLLEASYGITIIRDIDVMDDPDRPPNAHEVLCAYCAVKGYITNGTGRWDEFRACKDLLRDFTDGKILYIAPPFDPSAPGMESTINRWLSETEIVMLRRDIVAERLCMRRLKEAELEEQKQERQRQRRAAAGVGGGVRKPGATAAAGATVAAGDLSHFVYGEEGEFAYQAPDGESEAVDGQTEGAKDDGDDQEEGEYAVMGEGEEEEQLEYDEDTAVDTTTSNKSGRATREHKKLKHWGKKNKKFSDKDPYGDHNGKTFFVATYTNRTINVK